MRDRINPYYLLSWLRSSEGRTAIQSCIRGQTAHLYPGDVRELEIPLPSPGSEREIESLEKTIREALHLREASKSLARGSAADFKEIVMAAVKSAESESRKQSPRLQRRNVRRTSSVGRQVSSRAKRR